MSPQMVWNYNDTLVFHYVDFKLNNTSNGESRALNWKKGALKKEWFHNDFLPQLLYGDVIMSAMASQITGVSMVSSNLCSGLDQRKHQSSASLDFVREIQRRPVNSPHKGPETRKPVVTCEFPSQRTRNAENVSIWWRHHGTMYLAL